MIRVIAVGKKHESWILNGIERYEKRLSKPWTVEWLLLPHSTFDEAAAKREESARILDKISPDDYVILLDERGKNIDSPALSLHIKAPLEQSKRVICVIGGAYGVDTTLFERADFVWSLSKLVFPHQLVRLMLVEQLYRAQEIAAGKPYHHK